MSFRQLHYTSCEKGLSGHSGFQFCAMTPGVRREIMREIERLTIYEPPRSTAIDDRTAGNDAYPVNLLVTFSELADVIIIARIAYIGVDFSNRSGNYFVHALVGDTSAHAPAPLLPVELWEAPFWTERQGDMPDLPMLPDVLPPGPLTRDEVSVLMGTERETALTPLLAAIDEAMNGGRQVLLVAVHVDAVCLWIAAACYLMGPDLASRLTFTTYSHDPRRCSTHIIGTVESAGPFRADAIAHTAKFNLAQGILPDVAPSPAASLVARIGIAQSSSLWELVAILAPSSGASLSTLFPVLASAALLLEHELIPREFEAAVSWLASVGPPLAEYSATAIEAALRHPIDELSVRRQAELIGLALQADEALAVEQDLAGQVECALVNRMLTRIDRGEQIADIVPLRTDCGRRAASDGCSDRLSTGDARHAIGLLAWAAAANVQPPEDAILRVGQNAVIDALLEGHLPDGLDQVAQDWPALRRGALNRIAALPTGMQQFIFDNVGTIFTISDFANNTVLREDWLVSSVQQGCITAVDACEHIVRLRQVNSPTPAMNDSLLARLWPQRGWTAAEAARVLTRLPPEELTSKAVRQQFVSLLKGGAEDAFSDDWMTFVMRLSMVPELIRLDHRLYLVKDLAHAIELLRRAEAEQTKVAVALPQLMTMYEIGTPAVCQLLDRQLPPLFLRYPRSGLLLAVCPQQLFSQYCRYTRNLMERQPHNPEFAAWIYLTMRELQDLHNEYHEYLDDDVLWPVLSRWNHRELRLVAEQLDLIRRTEGAYFKLWVGRYRRPWLFGPRYKPQKR